MDLQLPVGNAPVVTGANETPPPTVMLILVVVPLSFPVPFTVIFGSPLKMRVPSEQLAGVAVTLILLLPLLPEIAIVPPSGHV